MYPLLLCSLVALTAIIERAIYWVTLDLSNKKNLIEDILEHCRLGEWDEVRKKSAGTRNPVLRVLISGILHRDYNLTKAMESAAMDQMKAMKRFMGILDTIITVAPLLGIFGTVTGIITSFEMLGAAGIEDPKAVTSGIAQALITTAAGLGIAILTVFPYNYFNSRVENAAVSIETYATRLEIVCNGQPDKETEKKMRIPVPPTRKPRIEMLPLIDIVFLLLVFFIYAMLSMAVHRGLPVQLPASTTSELEKKSVIAITITENGAVYLDNTPVALSELGHTLRDALADSEDTFVQVFADRALSYQQLFSVLDQIKLSGAKQISLQAVAE